MTLFTAFAPGSGPDATLRLVADKLGRLWNQRVMVENRPGGGFIAMEAARRTAADGYTLLQLDSDHLGAVPHLYKQRGAAAVGAFEPVASIFRTTFLVAVGTDSKWKTMTDLITTISKAVPTGLEEGARLGRTLHTRADDVLAYFELPRTSNGPTEAINGRLEHLRGIALGFRNLTNYIARSLLEAGGFKPRLHPRLG